MIFYCTKEKLDAIDEKLEKQMKAKEAEWELEKHNYIEVPTIAAGKSYIHKNLLRKYL